MLSLHAHTETFPVRIAPVPVRFLRNPSDSRRFVDVFSNRESLQPSQPGKHLSIRRLTRGLTATSRPCLPIRPLLGPPI